MDPDKILQKLEKKADYSELFYSEDQVFKVKTVKDKVEFAQSNTNSYYQIRIIKAGKIGVCSFREEKDADKAINTALKISKYSKEYDSPSFPAPVSSKEQRVNKKALETPQEEMESQLLNVIDSLKKKSVTVTQAGVTKSLEKSELYTTEGAEIEWDESFYSAYADISYKGTETWEEKTSIKYFDLLDLENKLEWLAQNTCGGKRVSGETTVLLPPETVSELVDAFFTPAISHYNVLLNKSVFKSKRKKQVSSENLTVYDDPGLQEGLFTREHDPEGVKCTKKHIIQSGMLQDFIRDLKSSWLTKENPTGHAYRTTIGVNESPTNLTFDSKNMIEEQDFSGVFIRDVLGVHTCNHLTGDFSLEVSSGAVMKKGEPTSPVRNCVLVGNFFELLKNMSLSGQPEQRDHYVGPGWVFKGKII